MRIYFIAIIFASIGCVRNSNTPIRRDLKPAPTVTQKQVVEGVELNDEQFLGSKIFADQNLSTPRGQSCQSCHSPNSAFSDPDSLLPVSQGALATNFGGRNTPSAMYTALVPPLHLETSDEGEESFVGGLFVDGRVSSLADQAKGPFVNPIEMGSTKLDIVSRICQSPDYGALFKKVFGQSSCQADEKSWSEQAIEATYSQVAQAIASFESTAIFAPFSSKFDKVSAGTETFTEQELRGFELFKNEKKANCAACHTVDADSVAGRALFTDHTYDNLGIPKNSELANLGHTETDFGLYETTKREENKGGFRVPSLRNIARTAPYGHNGYFKTLEQVVDFYNTRDTKPTCRKNLSAEQATKKGCWPMPEVELNENKEELGDLKLSESEQRDLIEFLKTLSDSN